MNMYLCVHVQVQTGTHLWDVCMRTFTSICVFANRPHMNTHIYIYVDSGGSTGHSTILCVYIYIYVIGAIDFAPFGHGVGVSLLECFVNLSAGYLRG